MGGDMVQLSEVDTKVVRAIHFLDHVWLRDPLTLGRCDNPLLEHSFDGVVDALVVERRATSGSCVDGAGVACRNCVVNRKTDRGRFCRWCRQRGKGGEEPSDVDDALCRRYQVLCVADVGGIPRTSEECDRKVIGEDELL